MRTFVLALGLLLLAALPVTAQTPLTLTLGGDVTALTNFGSYFSLPVGVSLGATAAVVPLAPGLALSAGGMAGWWMESFRDTFRFLPELVPVMIPVGADLGLLWAAAPTLSLGVGVQVGVVLEICPGERPTLLLLLSPGVDLRWFFLGQGGGSLRLGWTWMGADPIWGGPSIQAGPILRRP